MVAAVPKFIWSLARPRPVGTAARDGVRADPGGVFAKWAVEARRTSLALT